MIQSGFDAGSKQKLCVISCASGAPIELNMSCGYQCVKNILPYDAKQFTLKCVCHDTKGNGCGWQLAGRDGYISQHDLTGLVCNHQPDYDYIDGKPSYRSSQPTYPSQPKYPTNTGGTLLIIQAQV